MSEPMTDKRLAELTQWPRGWNLSVVEECCDEIRRLREENERINDLYQRVVDQLHEAEGEIEELRKVVDALSSRKQYHADLDEFSIIPDGKAPTHYLVEYGPLNVALRELDEAET